MQVNLQLPVTILLQGGTERQTYTPDKMRRRRIGRGREFFKRGRRCCIVICRKTKNVEECAAENILQGEKACVCIFFLSAQSAIIGSLFSIQHHFHYWLKPILLRCISLSHFAYMAFRAHFSFATIVAFGKIVHFCLNKIKWVTHQWQISKETDKLLFARNIFSWRIDRLL